MIQSKGKVIFISTSVELRADVSLRMSALSFAEVRAEFERKRIRSSQIRLSISAGCAALNYECSIPFRSRLFNLRYPCYRSKNNGFAASRPSDSSSSAEAYTLWLHQCTSNQRPVSAFFINVIRNPGRTSIIRTKSPENYCRSAPFHLIHSITETCSRMNIQAELSRKNIESGEFELTTMIHFTFSLGLS